MRRRQGARGGGNQPRDRPKPSRQRIPILVQRLQQQDANHVAVVVLLHAGGEFGGVLPAVGEHDELARGLAVLLHRHLARHGGGYHLNRLLKPRAMRAYRGIQSSPPSVIGVASRTLGRQRVFVRGRSLNFVNPTGDLVRLEIA